MSFTIDTLQAPTNTTVNGHNATRTSTQKNVSCDTLQQVFQQVLTEKQESTNNLRWIDDETVEVTTVSGQCMHQFALRAEELGKEVSYQKKVFIKIKDK